MTRNTIQTGTEITVTGERGDSDVTWTLTIGAYLGGGSYIATRGKGRYVLNTKMSTLRTAPDAGYGRRAMSYMTIIGA